MNRNFNRLINDFRNQTYLTIWKHMNAMAVNYAVYSNRIKGFAPYLYNCDIYIYADSINMVVVCVDCNKHTQKQCYDETQNINMMIYEPGCEPRESTVWKLKETMEIMKSRLRKSQASLKVYGILLTEADVISRYVESDLIAAHKFNTDTFRVIYIWQYLIIQLPVFIAVKRVKHSCRGI